MFDTGEVVEEDALDNTDAKSEKMEEGSKASDTAGSKAHTQG